MEEGSGKMLSLGSFLTSGLDHLTDVKQNYYLDVFGDVDLTRPQVAEARLFDQLTLLVGVRDPHGQAAATGL